MNYKELLPSRIPEALQDDNNLKEYLEVAGELFDEFADAIRNFDHYADPLNIEEHRLRDLAAQFAMEFPRNINAELQRVIIQDLEAIYQKSGTIDVVNWIFRLVGWNVELENAWVLNPEIYDPEIKAKFGLDDYGLPQSPQPITDFYRRDYRAFLLGHELVFNNGTYFRGRRFFDQNETFLKNEIVGEYYDQDTKTRTPDKVMATPYIFIRVSEEDYNIFISPYTDEQGNVFDYTQVEFFRVVENILNFFLFEDMRATHTRVVIIVTPQLLRDDSVINDEFEETWVSEPVTVIDDGVVGDKEESILLHDLIVGPNFLVGAPPSPFNKDMVLSAIGYRNLVSQYIPPEYLVDHEFRNYTIIREEDYPVARCGTDSFRFYTPHETAFWFRRVYTSENTLLDPTNDGSGVTGYPDDLESLTLNFDLITNTFGIEDAVGIQEIIIRNPTNIASYNINPPVEPANSFRIGEKLTGSDDFDPNLIIGFDFREEGELLADLDPKEFFYVYGLEIKYKESNLGTTWITLSTNPTQDDLNTFTEANTIVFVFAEQIPYDFEVDIEYQPQPTWENRETYNVYDSRQ